MILSYKQNAQCTTTEELIIDQLAASRLSARVINDLGSHIATVIFLTERHCNTDRICMHVLVFILYVAQFIISYIRLEFVSCVP